MMKAASALIEKSFLSPRKKKERVFRHYNGLCASFKNEPTSSKVAVVPCGDKGEGLAACRGFRKGDIVFKFWGRVLNEQSLYTLQIRPGLYIEDPIVMGKVLHSCDPNMSCDMETLTFTAIRPIMPGDLLTMDYESTEDELFRPFGCGCKSSGCRGKIRGRKYAALANLG